MPLDARRSTMTPLAIAILWVFAVATPLLGQTAPAIGAHVVIKAGVPLKVGEQVVDTGKGHKVYKVERANGEWLWLVAGDTAGWARQADVLTLDQAVAVYTAEIKRDPHAPWTYYNRGLIHQDRGKLDEALADYSAAIRQDVNFVPALTNRGNIWMFKKGYDRAIVDFTGALELEPRSILLHLNRGIAFQFKGEFDKALADYDEAIRLGLNTASAFNNRGLVRELKHDYDGAIVDYTAAIRLAPAYTLAWMNRGSARQAKGDYEQALADFSEATRLAPKVPLGYARRAWILATCPVAAQRNGKQAVALAQQAAEMTGNSDPLYLDVQAAAFAEAGEFAKAVFWETRAIASVKKTAARDAEAYRSRLKLYQQNQPYREERQTDAQTPAQSTELRP